MPTPTKVNRIARKTAFREICPGLHVSELSLRISVECWATDDAKTLTPKNTIATPDHTEKPVGVDSNRRFRRSFTFKIVQTEPPQSPCPLVPDQYESRPGTCAQQLNRREGLDLESVPLFRRYLYTDAVMDDVASIVFVMFERLDVSGRVRSPEDPPLSSTFESSHTSLSR
jgi:hypothetical protein